MASGSQRAKAARQGGAASASTPVSSSPGAHGTSRPTPLGASTLPPENGAALPRLEPTLPEGMRLGAFEIKGVIAQSRAAVIYRVADHSLGVPAAIKEYMPLSVARRGRNYHVEPVEVWHEDTIDLGRRAFFSESRALARCDDPALLRVTQLWEINGTAYRVMPLYSGKRLVDLRREMKAPIDEVALRALMHRLLDALSAYHASAGGVHGNVTPANILMPALDRPLLLGPGKTSALLATDLGEPARNDFEAAFAAPEQLEPQATVGVSADLFGLAQTLRYCITGGPPIGHESLRAAIHRVLGAGAVSTYSDALLDALTSLTANSPNERPQSVEEFRTRLRRLDSQSAAAAAAPPAVVAAAVAAPIAARTALPVAAPIAAPVSVPLPAPSAGPTPAPIAAPAKPVPVTPPPTAAAPAEPARETTRAAPPHQQRIEAPAEVAQHDDEDIDETIDVSSVLGDLPREFPAPTPNAPAYSERVEPTLDFGNDEPKPAPQGAREQERDLDAEYEREFEERLHALEQVDARARANASAQAQPSAQPQASAQHASSAADDEATVRREPHESRFTVHRYGSDETPAPSHDRDPLRGSPAGDRPHGADAHGVNTHGANAHGPNAHDTDAPPHARDGAPGSPASGEWPHAGGGFPAYGVAPGDDDFGLDPHAERRPSIFASRTLRLSALIVAILALAVVVILAVSGVWDPRGPQLDLPPPATDQNRPLTPAEELFRSNPSPVLPAASGAAPSLPLPGAATAASAPIVAPAAPPAAATRSDKSSSRRGTKESARDTKDGSAAKEATTSRDGAAEAANDPRDTCAGRTQFAFLRCMQTQCGRPRWASHPECVKLRHTEVGAG